MIAGSGVYTYFKLKKPSSQEVISASKPIKKQPEYNIHLASGANYQVAKATHLSFDIRDQSGITLKNFDVVHEKKLHLIVMRKDRTNFQHIHPEFDETIGVFTLNELSFPADGEYRVYADFTPNIAQKDELGTKIPSTPYQDIVVGDVASYKPTVITKTSIMSSVDGLEAEIFDGGNDGGGSGYTAGTSSSIAISLTKNGQAFKGLESYLGALGHMVAIGPDLEFIHAHANNSDVSTQSGIFSFGVDFPKPGLYKLFLQTQASGKITTSDFAVNVKQAVVSKPPTKNNAHGGH